VPSSAPSHDYTRILGCQAILKPSGENVDLDSLLPRCGTLGPQIALADWGSDWLVFTLGEPLQYDGAPVLRLLIRGRWVGCPIGSDFCPVFVLTDRNDALSIRDWWSSKEFQFVSWAEVEVIGT
jgi:hypothetical protein